MRMSTANKEQDYTLQGQTGKDLHSQSSCLSYKSQQTQNKHSAVTAIICCSDCDCTGHWPLGFFHFQWIYRLHLCLVEINVRKKIDFNLFKTIFIENFLFFPVFYVDITITSPVIAQTLSPVWHELYINWEMTNNSPVTTLPQPASTCGQRN